MGAKNLAWVSRASLRGTSGSGDDKAVRSPGRERSPAPASTYRGRGWTALLLLLISGLVLLLGTIRGETALALSGAEPWIADLRPRSRASRRTRKKDGSGLGRLETWRDGATEPLLR